MINYAKKYRIVQHEFTKKYKVQKKFLGLFWCDVHEHYSTLDLQYAQELMNDLIKDDIAEDRSLWKSI